MCENCNKGFRQEPYLKVEAIEDILKQPRLIHLMYKAQTLDTIKETGELSSALFELLNIVNNGVPCEICEGEG